MPATPIRPRAIRSGGQIRYPGKSPPATCCREDIKCSSGHSETPTQTAQQEGQRYQSARQEFQLAARRAQGVDEQSPAQVRDGCELTARMYREIEFTHARPSGRDVAAENLCSFVWGRR